MRPRREGGRGGRLRRRGRCCSELGAEDILAAVLDVEEAVGVLVALVDLRHEQRRLRHDVVAHKDVDRLLGRHRHVLADLGDELGDGQLARRQESARGRADGVG